MTRKGLPAQAAIEFTAVFGIFLALFFGIAYFSYAGYERAQLHRSLTTLAADLPAGWEDLPAEQLARELILEGSDLDADSLEVESASVTADSEVDVSGDSAIAEAHGVGVRRTERRRVTVAADVSYTFEDSLSFGRTATAEATARRSYTLYTDFRVG